MGIGGAKMMAYKLGESFKCTTLVHGITEVHERANNDALDTLTWRTKLCLTSPHSGRKTAGNLLQNTS